MDTTHMETAPAPDTERDGSRAPYWLPVLTAMAVAGFVLRLVESWRPFVGHHDFHTSFYAVLADGRLLSGYYKWPPLTTWLHQAGLVAFPFLDAELATRLLPILLSTAGVVVVAYLARALFDRTTALVAAGLLAIMPMDVYFARTASYHPLLILAILGCVRWYQTGQRRFFALAVFSSALISAFVYQGSVMVALAVLPLALLRRDWRAPGSMLLAGMAVAAAWVALHDQPTTGRASGSSGRASSTSMIGMPSRIG
jgi:4-amino-4-deoxy-L-arabinose transferase-like glycosyltransferase